MELFFGRKQQEKEIMQQRAAWEVETGHQEKEMPLQGQCCAATDHPEGVGISPRRCVSGTAKDDGER